MVFWGNARSQNGERTSMVQTAVLRMALGQKL